MKNNKKGFTLIELLAVIVVLAIIMVIATGQVTKTINDARKNSFTSSYKMIIKEIKNRIVESDMDMTSREVVCYEGDTDTCLVDYDLSADDYVLKVENDNNNNKYKVTFAGKTNGKFANVDYSNDTTNGDCPIKGACYENDGTSKDEADILNTIVVYIDKATGAVSATN